MNIIKLNYVFIKSSVNIGKISILNVLRYVNNLIYIKLSSKIKFKIKGLNYIS